MSFGWPSSIGGSSGWGPPTCFSVCGNIRAYGTNFGNDPTVCDSDSTFLNDYATCLACVKDYPSEEISGHLDELGPEYEEYCKSLGKDVPTAITSTVILTVNSTPEIVPITTTFATTTRATSTTPSLTSSISSSASSSISTTASIETSPASPQQTALPTSPKTQDATSQARVIGAAVGGTAGGFILALLIGFLWYRRRKQRRAAQSQLPSQPEQQTEQGGGEGVGSIASPQPPKSVELADTEFPAETKPWQELDNHPYYEMDASHAAVEVPGAEHAAELDDTSKRRSQLGVKDSPTM
ncbi:hypothetical protein GGR57DRAFT_259486 [Xylariaceae sp. FL1272]|nr:hypothetical protein GGR57DRAFT_259486 [Xylariaceae sp. FL1272]